MKNIFIALLLTVPFTGLAATVGNGCDEDAMYDNDRINGLVALCSTHAYNAGWTENPSSAADRETMREIIGMKTTVITQQMKKQYDYMDATVRRLKTQMRKAVLQSQLQAAGAAAEKAADTFSQTNRNIYIAGISVDCKSLMDYGKQLECLQNHYNTIYNQTNNGKSNNTGAMRSQLQTDYQTACDTLGSISAVASAGAGGSSNGSIEQCDEAKYPGCKMGSLSDMKAFQKCLDAFPNIIRTAQAQLQVMNRKNNNKD